MLLGSSTAARCATIAKLLARLIRLPVRLEKTKDLTIEYEQEDDVRWLAEALELPGVVAYGQTQEAAIAHAQALALRVLAERLDHGEATPTWVPIVFAAAA